MRPNGDMPPPMRAATAGAPGRRGLVPMPPAGSQTKFLRGDGTFQAISGGGDMLAANNLGDVASAATARTNLGVYSQAEVAALRNALAPAQALSFNGTAGSTLTLASTPSGDQTWAFDVQVPASNPSGSVGIFNAGGESGGVGTLAAYLTSAGALKINQFGTPASNYREASASGVISAYAGTIARVIITIASGAISVKVNDISLTLTETSGGTPPAWGATLTSGAVYIGKLGSTSNYFAGTLRLLGIATRAHSAAEVLQTYQTGIFPTSGAVCIPDPTQLGSGDKWYDVSGNNATTTLGGGVSWTLPWSGYIPGSPTVAGNLTAAGTGTHLFSGSLGLAYAGTQKWHLTGTTGGDLLFTRSGVADRMKLSSDGALSDMASVAIASTSAVKGVRTATAILDFPSIAAGASATLTVTVTGTVPGQCHAIVSTNESADMHDGLEFRAWVSATNTLSIKAINRTTGTIDQAAYNVRVTVFSF